jgi:hypothetical protein
MQLHMVEEARADAVRALALQQADVGMNFRSSLVGRAHLVFARALHAEGHLDQAREEYASALEHLEPTLGKDHPDTLEAAQGR